MTRTPESGPEATPTPTVATPSVESIFQKVTSVNSEVAETMFDDPRKEELTKMERFKNIFGFTKDKSNYKELTKQETGSVKKR